jgi:acetoin utilization protein AcuB
MNVSDIMTSHPTTIRNDRSVKEAIETMAQLGCHHLPVAASDGHLIGILTDHDCRRALKLPWSPQRQWEFTDEAKTILVRSVMTPAPITVEPEASADEAARLMLSNHINCLPVMRSETLVGIITTSDILTAFIKMHKSAHAHIID